MGGVFLGVGGEGIEGYEDGDGGEDGGRRVLASRGVVVGYVDVREGGAQGRQEVFGLREGESDEEVFFCWAAAHG